MTEAAALLELAARCEREEPSIDLDAAIYHAMVPSQHRNPHWCTYYTRSLDAAVTLVPPDPANPGKPMLWSITYDENGVGGERSFTGALGKGYHDPDYIYGHNDKSAALALCAAALRARAALAREPS